MPNVTNVQVKKYIMSDEDKLVVHEKLNQLTLKTFGPVQCKERVIETPLRWTPYAKAKLRWFRDNSKKGGAITEFTCYGVLRDGDDILFVDDIIIPRQRCEPSYVSIDSDDLSSIIEDMVFEEDYQPWQVSSMWIHTHPKGVNFPSVVDHNTFDSIDPDLFYIMYIITAGDVEFARMKVNGTDTVFHINSSEPEEKYEPTPEDVVEWNTILIDKVNEPTFVAWDIEEDKKEAAAKALKRSSLYRGNYVYNGYGNYGNYGNYTHGDNYYKNNNNNQKYNSYLTFSSPFYDLLHEMEDSLVKLDNALDKPDKFDFDEVFTILENYLFNWSNKIMDKYEEVVDQVTDQEENNSIKELEEELEQELEQQLEDDLFYYNDDIYGDDFEEAFNSMDRALSETPNDTNELIVYSSEEEIKKGTLDERH